MIKILLKWLALTLAVLATAYLVPGISVTTFVVALFVALVLGLVNTFIKPIISILTLPVNILTLGLFGIILNALFFWLASLIVTGFSISGFVPALIGSIVVSLIMWIIDLFI
jgi:putative membrane protein